MPGPVLTQASTVMCSHAGTATALTPFPRVTVQGAPIATLATSYAIVGCALTGTPNPPCASGNWVVGGTRVLAGGTPVAVQSGTGLAVPTGQPMLPVAGAPRVVAS